MQPKAPQEVDKEKKGPPSPGMVFAMSLFGYPGVGHFMIGKKKLGAGFMTGFTALTIGLLYEMYITISPLLAAYSGGDALNSISDINVNIGRIAFWIISTGIVWVFSGVHAMAGAKKLKAEMPQQPQDN